MNIRTLALSLAVAVGLFSASAFADDSSKHDKKDHNHKVQFPIDAAKFKTHSEERITHARSAMEKHITDKKIDADKAKEIRAKFEAGVVKVKAAVDKACEDGKVTKEEAKTVRGVAKTEMPHHGEKGGKGGKHHKKQ